MMTSKPYYEALPTDLYPVHYDVSISDINVEENKYSGVVKIHCDVRNDANEICLNYRDMSIEKENVVVENGAENIAFDKDGKIEVVDVISFGKKEFVALKFNKTVRATEISKLVLSISFQGTIQTNMSGFYRSEYTEHGESKVMLSTQFEAPDARRAFPCLDEPDLKATFTISLTVPQHWTALANMPVDFWEDIGDGLRKVVFQRSPKMSTYLVAWACGEFEYVESFTEQTYHDEKPLPIRIYTTTGYSKSAAFASSIAPRIIDYFSKVFKLKYPLPKLDLIAVHSFSHNGMENWGLVTYRSNALLFDEKTSNSSFRKQVCYVIAHEMAHMWFGDLVTMKWWDELWLNEGFATYVGYLAVDYLKPEWNIFNIVASESLQKSLHLDALRSSHPIQVPVIDAVDIDQLFDAISYFKGCSIILMLSNYIGTNTFLDGVSVYLNKNKFDNGTTVDLWNAIGEVSDKPVNKMMENWTAKIGFPVIDVEFNDTNLVITQSRFLSTGDVTEEEDSTLWWIPLNISSGPNPGDFVGDLAIDSFSSKRVIIGEFTKHDQFFKLNKDSTGFYRVNYSPEILQRNILPYLDKLSAKDKIGLFADVAAIAISGTSPATNTLTLLNLLKSTVEADQLGEDYSVWLDLTSTLNKLQIVFSGDDELSQGIDNFLKSIYFKVGDKLLNEVKANNGKVDESDFARVELTATIFNVSGGLGVPKFVEFAKQLFENWKSGGQVHPSLVFFVFSTVCSQPDFSEQEFEDISKELKNPSTLDSRELAIKALANVSNLKYLDKLFEYILDTSVVPLMETHYMAEAFTKNRKTRGKFWNYFKDNYDTFYKLLSTNVAVLERFVRFAFVNYQSAEMIKDFESFYKTKGTTGFERSYAQVIDNIKMNDKWYKRDQDMVRQWLKEQKFM